MHVVVHPLLHVQPLLVQPSGPDTFSVAIAGDHSQTRDCELCRTAGSLVPTVGIAVPAFFVFSSPVVTVASSDVFGLAHSALSSRAPPLADPDFNS
jgi:hypothetical protein